MEHTSKRFIKADKDFAKKLDFKHIQFPVNIRNIHKIKKEIVGISACHYENKEKHPIYVAKNIVTKKMLIYY